MSTQWPHVVLYEGSDEWSALYVDGTLDTVGDHYRSAERIQQLFEVVVIQSDDFLLGNQSATRDQVAKNLHIVNRYHRDLEDRKARAAQLREEAAALLEQAKELES